MSDLDDLQFKTASAETAELVDAIDWALSSRRWAVSLPSEREPGARASWYERGPGYTHGYGLGTLRECAWKIVVDYRNRGEPTPTPPG